MTVSYVKNWRERNHRKRMKKQQLVEKLASEMNTDNDNAVKWVDAVLEGIFQSLKRRENVTQLSIS